MGRPFLDGLPQMLNGVEVGRIAGQLTAGKLAAMGVEEGLGTLGGVVPGAILNNQ